MAELTAVTLAAVDCYWAAFFGCAPTLFATPTTIVLPHVGLGDYHGLWLFRRRATLIVSVPAARLEHDRAAFGELSAASFDDLPTVCARAATPIERVVGPAFIGYADPATFRPAAQSSARLLTASDWEAFERFRRSCPGLDWEHGGSTWGAQPIVGCFSDGALAAVAGFELWGARIAHIAVVTHPAYRGLGCGTAAVSAITQAALERDLIPQYRTLMRNSPSLAIGAALGFVPYAASIALRLGA